MPVPLGRTSSPAEPTIDPFVMSFAIIRSAAAWIQQVLTKPHSVRGGPKRDSDAQNVRLLSVAVLSVLAVVAAASLPGAAAAPITPPGISPVLALRTNLSVITSPRWITYSDGPYGGVCSFIVFVDAQLNISYTETSLNGTIRLAGPLASAHVYFDMAGAGRTSFFVPGEDRIWIAVDPAYALPPTGNYTGPAANASTLLQPCAHLGITTTPEPGTYSIALSGLVSVANYTACLRRVYYQNLAAFPAVVAFNGWDAALKALQTSNASRRLADSVQQYALARPRAIGFTVRTPGLDPRSLLFPDPAFTGPEQLEATGIRTVSVITGAGGSNCNPALRSFDTAGEASAQGGGGGGGGVAASSAGSASLAAVTAGAVIAAATSLFRLSSGL